jgi:hypothetical protein
MASPPRFDVPERMTQCPDIIAHADNLGLKPLDVHVLRIEKAPGLAHHVSLAEREVGHSTQSPPRVILPRAMHPSLTQIIISSDLIRSDFPRPRCVIRVRESQSALVLPFV